MKEKQFYKCKIISARENYTPYTHEQLKDIVSTKGIIENIWLTKHMLIIYSRKKITQILWEDIASVKSRSFTYRYRIYSDVIIVDKFNNEHIISAVETFKAKILAEYIDRELFSNTHPKYNPSKGLSLSKSPTLEEMIKNEDKTITANAMMAFAYFGVYMLAVGLGLVIYNILVPFIQTSVLENNYTLENYLKMELLPDISSILLGFIPLVISIVTFPYFYKRSGAVKGYLIVIAGTFIWMSGMMFFREISTNDILKKIEIIQTQIESIENTKTQTFYIQGFANDYSGVQVSTLSEYNYNFNGVDELNITQVYLTSGRDIEDYDVFNYVGDLDLSIFIGSTPLMYSAQEETPTSFEVTYVDLKYLIGEPYEYTKSWITNIERVD